MAAAKVFRDELYIRGHGTAMWEPEWEVHVGDVGFFLRTNGTFCRLFNILAPEGDSANARGVPTDFSPYVPTTREWQIKKHKFKPGAPLTSGNVRVLGGQVEFQVVGDSVIGAGIGVSYSCARAQGAILLPRAQTARVDLIDTMSIRRYIKQNIDAWYSFARDQEFGEEQAPEGSIRLVYGCDKSASWAAAAFTESSSSGSVFFNGGLTGGPLAELRGSWSLHHCASAEVNEGPMPGSPDSFRLGTTPPNAAYNFFPSNCRETVFVRAYTIKRKLAGLMWPLRIAAGAGPRDLDGDDLPEDPGAPAVLVICDDELEGSLRSNERRSPYMAPPTASEDVVVSDDAMDVDEDSTEEDRSGASVNIELEYHMSTHPIDAVVEHMLQNSPGAQLAIVTDDEISSLISEHGHMTADINECIQRMLEQAASNFILVEDGVAQITSSTLKAAMSEYGVLNEDKENDTTDRKRNRESITLHRELLRLCVEGRLTQASLSAALASSLREGHRLSGDSALLNESIEVERSLFGLDIQQENTDENSSGPLLSFDQPEMIWWDELLEQTTGSRPRMEEIPSSEKPTAASNSALPYDTFNLPPLPSPHELIGTPMFSFVEPTPTHPEELDGRVVTISCRFGGCLGMFSVRPNKIQGLTDHLRDYHGVSSQNHKEYECGWFGCVCTTARTSRCTSYGYGQHPAHVRDLASHIWNMHLNFRFACDKCGQAEWRSAHSLKRHREGHCKGKVDVRCSQCFGTFYGEVALERHIADAGCGISSTKVSSI